MSNFEALERQFRSLHQESVKSYDEKLKLRQKQEDHFVRITQRREKLAREIVQPPQLDQDQIDRLSESDKAAMEEYLNSVRPALIDRPPSGHLDAKRLSFQNSLEIPGMKKSTVYATSLLASEPSELSG